MIVRFYLKFRIKSRRRYRSVILCKEILPLHHDVIKYREVIMAKTRPKKPFIPSERLDTIRHAITASLTGYSLSAKDISQTVHISEKEVYGHMEHIRISLDKSKYHLIIAPALCEHCGFIFKKRDRLTKPGKCPNCRSERIAEPLFSVKGKTE
jgi:predicted Zn-ribbon and HTH transcriptional regulator